MHDLPDWVTSFPGAVTVSDMDHRIIYMNDKSAATYAADGGRALIGHELMACHNERSKAMIQSLLESGGQNVYTIDKAGQKKLIFQSAWRDETGQVAGLVEVSMVLPPGMPHYVRG
jgi:transcriptional regulator with PAS, ATPase and Fis domain